MDRRSICLINFIPRQAHLVGELGAAVLSHLPQELIHPGSYPENRNDYPFELYLPLLVYLVVQQDKTKSRSARIFVRELDHSFRLRTIVVN